jgi:hypothetical protein
MYASLYESFPRQIVELNDELLETQGRISLADSAYEFFCLRRRRKMLRGRLCELLGQLMSR